MYLGVNAVKKKGESQGLAFGTQPFVPMGKRLVAIVNNGVYQVAPDVTESREYDHFYESYAQGHWLRMDLYLLPEDLVKECPDEGQVPC